MRNFLNKITGKWFYAKCIFPYKNGYCTARIKNGRKTILDTGLTKEEAIAECKLLNNTK